MMNSRIRMGSDGFDACSECNDHAARSYECGCEKTAYEMPKSACGYMQDHSLDGYPLGMVYAPMQGFEYIHDLDTAMKRGTIFAQLDLPFLCSDRTKGGCCNG